MEKRKKSRGYLVVGIVAAVVVLAAMLVLLLTQCSGGTEAITTGANESTAAPVPTYDLYWNMDRAEYDGKSEAGMSSRQPEADGYFHIRFLLEGQEVTLKAADRKIVNKIDVEDVMGLEFDEEGLITGVLEPGDMPLELVGWKYYVQSVGGNLIKLNSAETFVGMELLLEYGDRTGIYDMTGMSGPVGNELAPKDLVIYDRVIAIADLAGELTHVFVYDRSNYMLTHEAECEHCKETVTWYEWTKTEDFPNKSGHYQLQNDVQLKGQQSLGSDVNICLDLNGRTITGKDNTRLISLHNVGTSFALMDTSEAQTGRLVGHTTSSPQGGIVWVRYGQFHMYGGTLDGSDMISRLNGTVVQVPKNAFFYMYGGTIIGGTAAPQYDESTGKYTYGLGGSVHVSGTMRMYGGTITGGKAPAAYYYSNGKLTVARGMGGNIMLASGAVLEITGGEISYGYAGNVGANIMMDGTAELIISGGSISGGWTDAKVSGKHGANIYCPAKATITMSGGAIEGGHNLTAGGGNLYLLGTMTMTGGCVFDGKAAASGGNIQMGSSAKLNLYAGAIWGGVSGNGGGNINMSSKATVNMYGGTITGGTAAVNGGNICGVSSGSFNLYGGTISNGVCNGTASGNGGGNIAVTANGFVLNISGGLVTGGASNGLVKENGSTTGGDGGNINLNRGTMTITGGTVTDGTATGNGGGIYVGWNCVGVTLSKNARIYGNTETDICRSANTAEGKSQIVLGAWNGNGDKGTLVVDRLSATAGTVLAIPDQDVTLTELDAAKFSGTHLVLPIVLGGEGNLILSPVADLGQGDHLHCLCNGSLSHTCTDTGFVSVTAEEFEQCWIANGANYDLAGSLNLCLREDVSLSAEYRLMGHTLNLCLNGHTVTMESNARITANGTTGVLNLTDCGGGKIVAAEGCRTSILYTYKGCMNIYGGTVDASLCKAGTGGVVNVGYDGDTFTLFGGTLIGSQKGTNGGTIYTNAAATVNICGGNVKNGKASTSGGNIYMGKGTLNVSGGTLTGGSATANGGGIYVGYNSTAFNLSGNAQICGNTGTDVYLGSKASNVIVLNGWMGNGDKGALVVGKLNSTVGTVLATGAEGVTLTVEDVAKLASNDDELILALSGGNIVLKGSFVHEHCYCGRALESHDCTDVSYTKVENTDDFLRWFDGSHTLTASVDLVLTGDITLDVEYKLGGKTLNLCLNGHTVTMEDKGRITANDGGTLNITDCSEDQKGTVKAAAGCQHSIVFAYVGQINLYSGIIDAGNISLSTSGSDNGGAVHVSQATATFTMYGGQIIGGTLYRGGAVYVDKGTFLMNGGKIHGGTANLGGNVAVNTGTFTMNGGEIFSGTCVDGKTNPRNGAGVFIGYGVTAPVTISGNARIYGNTGAADIHLGQNAGKALNFLTLNNWAGNGDTNGDGKANAMTVSQTDGVQTSVVAKPAEGTTLSDGDAEKIASFVGLKVTFNGTNLELSSEEEHAHCLCGGTQAGTEGHSCGELVFTEVDGDGFLALFNENKELKASTTVVLTGDVTLDAEYKMNGNTLNLCLNGHTITMEDKGRITANGTTGILNLTDCGNGRIVAAEGCRSGMLYTYKGEMNIYGGTVDASQCAAGNGGAVNVGYAGDAFTMYGGSLIGSQRAVKGGVLYATGDKTNVNIHGGTISGGKATDLGGNICMNDGVLTMTGGTVTGGEAVNGGSGICVEYKADGFHLSGNAKIYGNTGYDVRLNSAAANVITLGDWSGNSEGKAALKLVKMDGNAKPAAGAQAVKFDSGLTDQQKQAALTQFASGAAGHDLIMSAESAGMEMKALHYHCLCGGTLAGTEGHTCGELVFTGVDSDGFLALFNENKELKASTTVVLTGDVTLDAEYKMNGHTLNLCLNGHTVTMEDKGRITANDGGTLNISDCSEDQKGTVKAAAGCQHSIVFAYVGQINLYSGIIDAGNISLSTSGSDNGGAVHVSQATATFTMYGGQILGGTLYRGGAVYVDKGTFLMNGGKIHSGTANLGGNVAVNTGTFTMNGGEIFSGTCVDGKTNPRNGAGVFIGYGVTAPVTISGNARIYGNAGAADIHLGQNVNKHVNYMILDGWTGYEEQGAMFVSSANETAGAEVAVSKDGTVLPEAVVEKFACLNGSFGFALSDDGAKLVLTAK